MYQFLAVSRQSYHDMPRSSMLSKKAPVVVSSQLLPPCGPGRSFLGSPFADLVLRNTRQGLGVLGLKKLHKPFLRPLQSIPKILTAELPIE